MTSTAHSLSLALALLAVPGLVAALSGPGARRPAGGDGRYDDPLYRGEHGGPPARSPLSLDELDLLRTTVLLGDEDLALLRRSRALLEPRVEEVLDVWYGFVGANPHLLASFAGPDGAPDAGYLAAVRARFGRWILDTAEARFDRDWLDYQEEIGLRHHRSRKNATDGARASAIVPLRYLVALASPIAVTLEPFLAGPGVSAEEQRGMASAWRKAVLLQVVLWSRPYVRDGDF